jgi:hypothetical protein
MALYRITQDRQRIPGIPAEQFLIENANMKAQGLFFYRD